MCQTTLEEIEMAKCNPCYPKSILRDMYMFFDAFKDTYYGPCYTSQQEAWDALAKRDKELGTDYYNIWRAYHGFVILNKK